MVCCCLFSQAQDYQVNLKSWDVKDGLSDRQVNFIHKDRRGLIWLCTKKGITCFDSHRFQVYNKDKDGLLFDYLAWMTEDADGNFWLMGSPRLDKNNLFIFDPLTKKVTSFADKTGYKDEFTVNYLQKFNDSVLFFGHTATPFFFTWSSGRGLRKIPFPVRMKFVVTVSDHNTFWVQDTSGQLCEVDMQGRLLRRCFTAHPIDMDSGKPTLSSYAVHVPAPGQRHTHLPALKVRVRGDSADLVNMYENFAHVVFNTGVDSVIFRQGQLFRGDRLVKDLRTEAAGLKSNLTCAFFDDDGRIWMSNVFGFSLLTVTRSKFRKFFYQDPKTFSQNSYRTLIADGNTLYAVCEFQGVSEASIDSGAGGSVKTAPQIISGNYSLVKARNGKIFGLQFNFMYERDSKWTVSAIPKKEPKVNYWRIREIAPDSFLVGNTNGLTWFSLNKHAFYQFKGYNRYSELASMIVLEIVDDPGGHRWVCCSNGLYEYDDARGVIDRYSPQDSGTHYLPVKDAQHIYCDSGGIYWVATANGLVRWDRPAGKHRLFTIADGLSNNNLYAIYPDSFNRLWLSSDYGIMQFNKSNYHVKTYLVSDGISYNEFNRLSHTADSQGNLYFGTLDGVTSFNPRDFPAGHDDEKSATLLVSSFEQFDGAANRLLDRTADIVHSPVITLQPGDRFFNLNFALLAYNDALHTTYYWKIDGIDSAWMNLKEPTLRISGLPYGTMKLRIKAQASDGSWGRNELQFTIHVIKPVYLRTWFIVLAILVVVGSIVGGYRWRVVMLRRENERLDTLVRQKTTELEKTIGQLRISSKQKDVLMKETHHRVKNNLQVISTLLSLQLNKIDDDDARRSIEESSARINSIALVHYKLYKGEQLNTLEISGFAGELLAQLKVVYLQSEQEMILENTIPETWLDIDTALPLGLILNELMTNSFKYAYEYQRKCRMQIGLVHRGDTYILQYVDNGPGLPEGYDVKKGKTLGVTIIKSLAKQLGGSFSYNADENCFMVKFLNTDARKNIA